MRWEYDSEDIYKQRSTKEIDENDEISASYENGSLKVEINTNSKDENITLLDKQPLDLRNRLRQ